MTLFRRKKFVVNQPDPSSSVIYLGNVVTIMAKGESAYERPMALIWKTYCSRTRPDLSMQLSVTTSGLKALTKAQGLTEYWAHRITFSVAPAKYARVFVWIYKHEGKKMKPEMRCHAVLCKKPDQPCKFATSLQCRVATALQDYRREKMYKQNCRLSLGGGTGTLPRRKQLLITGSQNFRPPMERSKSAPKLHPIDEDEEEDEENEENFQENHDFSEPSNSYSPGTPKNHRDLDADLVFCEDPTGLIIYQDCTNTDDTDFLSLEEKVRLLMLASKKGRPKSTETESDSISDESGYHEGKGSVESDDMQISDSETANTIQNILDDDWLEVTAL